MVGPRPVSSAADRCLRIVGSHGGPVPALGPNRCNVCLPASSSVTRNSSLQAGPATTATTVRSGRTLVLLAPSTLTGTASNVGSVASRDGGGAPSASSPYVKHD